MLFLNFEYRPCTTDLSKELGSAVSQLHFGLFVYFECDFDNSE